MSCRFAQCISVVGHPFVFSPLIALFVGLYFLGPWVACQGILTIVLFCLLPIALLISRKVRRGEWSDLDVSSRRDRPQLFTLGVCFLLLALLILRMTHQPAIFARSCIAAITLVVSGWCLNRWLKPSMHVGFATLTSCTLWPFGWPIGLVSMLFALLVGWSRVRLHRHTSVEALIGFGLGVLNAQVILQGSTF